MNLLFFIDIVMTRLWKSAAPLRVARATSKADALGSGNADIVFGEDRSDWSSSNDSGYSPSHDWDFTPIAAVDSSDRTLGAVPPGELHRGTDINPASGLIMVGGAAGLDVGGNLYGTSADDTYLSGLGCTGATYDCLASFDSSSSLDCFSSSDCFSSTDSFDSYGSGGFGSDW
ncbi:hypothetical protein [Novilysobacter spongiicola]|uniref:Uncharacterized protein n=1 Tax=Lysobacter spongiicola DSM 21749 TaxID=1122188 RepID=A0A1T4PSH6_9GAMM|nr:hypothetical protein [Lysobacter spongiicola]SJZ94157.1 hypothetical protein SAMN02745674_01350 [Lysobacter spongiicola DSM 21749]